MIDKMKSKYIKELVDSGEWKDRTSEVSVTKESNLIRCPNCKGSNTRRIQNALTFIINQPFYQGEEWVGYCHDCGTLYEYYTDKIMYVPKEKIRNENEI